MRCSPRLHFQARIVLCLSFCWLLFISTVIPAPRARINRRPNGISRIQQNAATAPRRTNELLVRFRGIQSEQKKNEIAAAHGLRRQRSLRGESGVDKLSLTPGMDVDNAVWQLVQDPAVEVAEQNFLLRND